MTLFLNAYKGLTSAATPILNRVIAKRLARGKEDPKRVAERKGVTSFPRPEGLVVWLHAASVGESLSILPLVDAFIEGVGAHVLVTTGSVTSARLMELRLPEKATHQFIPVDQVNWVRRFLDHWQPDMAVFVESEFWPNLMRETKARGIPAALVNARITEKSFGQWQWVKGSIRELLSLFQVCLAQDAPSADRLWKLGAENVIESGNLRHAAPPLPVDEEALSGFLKTLGNRPLFLAASTHEGEEDIALSVHDRLIETHPDLLTVIVPRHPERGNALTTQMLKDGRAVAQRSKGDGLHDDVQIYLADTLGELGLFFRAASLVFLGGSFVDVGGHNPLEPVRLDCAMVHGPSTYNHVELYWDLHKEGAVVQVEDAGQLAELVQHWLANPEQAQQVAAKGKAYADRMTFVFLDVLKHLKPLIEQARQNRGGQT